MSYDRTTLARGRGQVTLGGQTLLSRDPITVAMIHTPVPVTTANAGQVDTLDRDRRVEITFTPVGGITSGLLGVLYGPLAKKYGQRLLGDTDAAAVVYFEAGGKSITVHNAAVTSMPELTLAAGVPPFGRMTITGLIRNTYDWADANAFYTEASASYPGDSITLSQFSWGAASAAWGATSPWDEMFSGNGWRIGFNMALTPAGPDGTTRDFICGEQRVTVTGRPIGITLADLTTKIGGRVQEAGLGNTSLRNVSDDLVVTTSGMVVTVTAADLNERLPLVGGPMEDVVGPLTWGAVRTHDTGAQVALASVAVPV